MGTRRVAVRGIIFNDGKLLVSKVRENGKESKHWATFGGGLDPGEPITGGLYREMIEETGIAPKIGKLLFIQQFGVAEKEHLEFFFHIENVEDYKSINLEGTSHGTLELTKWDYVDPKTNFVLPAFLQSIDIEKAITTDRPVFIYNNL